MDVRRWFVCLFVCLFVCSLFCFQKVVKFLLNTIAVERLHRREML